MFDAINVLYTTSVGHFLMQMKIHEYTCMNIYANILTRIYTHILRVYMSIQTYTHMHIRLNVYRHLSLSLSQLIYIRFIIHFSH